MRKAKEDSTLGTGNRWSWRNLNRLIALIYVQSSKIMLNSLFLLRRCKIASGPEFHYWSSNKIKNYFLKLCIIVFEKFDSVGVTSATKNNSKIYDALLHHTCSTPINLRPLC